MEMIDVGVIYYNKKKMVEVVSVWRQVVIWGYLQFDVFLRYLNGEVWLVRIFFLYLKSSLNQR